MFCVKCAGHRYLPAIGKALQCGHQSPRMGMQYCPECSEKKKVCETCGEKLPKKSKKK